MALADKIPDLENMTEAEMEAWAASLSPEELMEFMNLLALRQGATEGVTSTDNNLELPTIDASKVTIDEPGYIPFGEESTFKSAPKEAPAAPPPAARQPPPVRQAPPAPPAPTPPAREALRPAASTPPWDTPASRPAAASSSEPPRRPVTPPDTAPAPRPKTVEPPAAARPVQPPAPPPQPPAAIPPAAEAVDSGALAWLESLAAEQGEDLFNLDLSGIGVTDQPEVSAQLDNPMNWLEDLARSQGEQDSPLAFELDTLDDDIISDSEKIDPFASKADPVTWLETLARRGGADPDELITSTQFNIPTPAADAVEPPRYEEFRFETPLSRPRAVDEDSTPVNPSDFLSSLAEGYNEDGVVATRLPRQPEPVDELEDIHGLDDDYSLEEIQDALSKGTVTADQMQQFLDAQADHLAEHPELLMGDEEEVAEEPPLVAEIPEWLREMQPPEQSTASEDNKALEALLAGKIQPLAEAEIPDWFDAVEPVEAESIEETEQVQEEAEQSFQALFTEDGQPTSLDIPDWLLETEGAVTVQVDDIFAGDNEEPAVPAITMNVTDDIEPYVIEVDPHDPWVEAFDQELDEGAQDPDVVPAWYERNINDPERVAAVDRRFGVDDVREPLAEAPFPAETGLPLGQPHPLPSWIVGLENLTAAAEAAPATAFIGDMPEWLKDIEVPADEIPGWLQDSYAVAPIEPENLFTVELEPQPEPGPEPEPPPRPAAARPVAPPPAPKPAPAPARPSVVNDEEAMEVLQAARDLEQAGDLETSLVEYEGLIRSNRALDVVVEDLSQLVKSYRTVPAVYRVLGDGLMRQGKLQAALDTYRNALNQL
ncbi:MAG: hypothetical protein IPK19_09840 [Chloroflexi bacterium]|nr:hypothetical protein [Chloroflexota bacterium]